jgi:hypothetical protein
MMTTLELQRTNQLGLLAVGTPRITWFEVALLVVAQRVCAQPIATFLTELPRMPISDSA